MEEIYLKGIFAPIGVKGQSGLFIDAKSAKRIVKNFELNDENKYGIFIGDNHFLNKDHITHEVISIKYTSKGIEGLIKILDTEVGNLVKSLIKLGYVFYGDAAIDGFFDKDDNPTKICNLHSLHITMQYTYQGITNLRLYDPIHKKYLKSIK